MHVTVVTDCAGTPPHVRVGHAEGGLDWQLNVVQAGTEHGRDCGVQAAHPAPPRAGWPVCCWSTVAGADDPTPSMTMNAMQVCVICWMPVFDPVEHEIEH
jgi:hypothetical protein